MIKNYRFTLSIGFVGAKHDDEFPIEFPDDATEDDIEEIVQEEWLEWSNNYIDGGWHALD